MSEPNRQKIIHIDMDCFYAAVEMRDQPELRGIPIAVGGTTRRGVLTTCNYEARAFGVRSAMPNFKALQLCPQLKIVKPRFDRYREESRAIRSIFRRYTERIEPLSLDEAYLDVSHRTEHATRLAREIRRVIREERDLPASAGIAPNKMLAKVASDWRKPDGQFTIPPDQVDAFVAELPIRKIPGVGPKTQERLESQGILTCSDLQLRDLAELTRNFGKFGLELYERCRGIDTRAVETDRPRKSCSVERTFRENIPDLPGLTAILPELLEALAGDLEALCAPAPIRKVFVKLKFDYFENTTAYSLAARCDLFLFVHTNHLKQTQHTLNHLQSFQVFPQNLFHFPV